ncbi:rRNA maturation RNase YbeY [Candidatus Margulisiibacteriota bacterium]
MKVLINEIVKVPYKEEIDKVVKKALKAKRKTLGVVSITFVDDKYIQDLNKKYNFKDKPTDVLSFSLGETRLLGDVFISVPFAHKNAKRFQHSLLAELKRLAVHGTLHLLGYKHKTIKEKDKMEKFEQKILTKEH